MFTQGFAEIITDVLTINPSLQAITSASSILDTSNYTFNAITFGKDAEGFKFHSHVVTDLNGPIEAITSSNIYNSGYVLVRRYNTLSPSSYHTSSTHLQFSSIYNSVPNYPSIYDTRLERASTISNVISVSTPVSTYDTPNLGHYPNPVLDPVFSSIWNVLGGYPPSGNSTVLMLIDSSGTFVCSANLSGVFNSQGVVDKNGFIKINPIVNINNPSSGPVLSTSGSLLSNPSVYVQACVQLGDTAALAAFGGINHIGVWCLDLKQMLGEGLMPPYSWNNLNNTRKYKLVAKATLWDNILNHADEPLLGISGLISLSNGFGYNNAGFSGPVFVLQFKFK